MNKASRESRRAKIKDLVAAHEIETQEDLAARLRTQGIEITQATISRDIKELMLIKAPIGDGRYRYALPSEKESACPPTRLSQILRDSVVSVADSENLVVIKTLPGAANAVASVLDGLRWRDVIGTVAGDDSILVVVKPRQAAKAVMKRLHDLIHAR